MKRAIISILIAASLLSVPPAAGQSQPTITCAGEPHPVDTQDAVALYNENTDAVPSVLTGAIASNTTEIRIENASQEYYTVRTNTELNVTDVSVGPADDPDLIVRSDRDTACDAYTASDRVGTLKTAYENDDITIEATGTLDKAKVFVGERAVDVLNMF